MENDKLMKQSIVLESRKKLMCELVENVDSFTEDTVILKTKLGSMEIKGTGFKLIDFSVEEGIAIIDGLVDSLIFLKTKEKRSFVKGLFR